jgi:hypothetical protein
MQFLRSIKSVKALGLAAATAATLISSNIAPTVAQTPTGSAVSTTRTIKLVSRGAHTARFFVVVDGQPSQSFDNTIPFGQSKEINYPAGTKVTVAILNTERGRPAKVILFQPKFALNDNICFQTIGTLFNPAAGRC